MDSAQTPERGHPGNISLEPSFYLFNSWVKPGQVTPLATSLPPPSTPPLACPLSLLPTPSALWWW